MLRNTGAHHYECNFRFPADRKFRMGYAAQADNSQFSLAVTEGLRRAAARELIDLIVLDNRYSARAALRNAERLISERVDLAFEFQTYERVAGVVSSRFQEAGIPVIAIEIPHPGPPLRRQQLSGRPQRRTSAGSLGQAELGQRCGARAYARTAHRRCVTATAAGGRRSRHSGDTSRPKPSELRSSRCSRRFRLRPGSHTKTLTPHAGPAYAARWCKRPQRSRSATGVRGSRTFSLLCGNRSGRHSRCQGGVVQARVPADRVRCFLPRIIWRGPDSACAGHSGEAPHTARCLCKASTHYVEKLAAVLSS